jgi:hypothetical protein
MTTGIVGGKPNTPNGSGGCNCPRGCCRHRGACLLLVDRSTCPPRCITCASAIQAYPARALEVRWLPLSRCCCRCCWPCVAACDPAAAAAGGSAWLYVVAGPRNAWLPLSLLPLHCLCTRCSFISSLSQPACLHTAPPYIMPLFACRWLCTLRQAGCKDVELKTSTLTQSPRPIVLPSANWAQAGSASAQRQILPPVRLRSPTVLAQPGRGGWAAVAVADNAYFC